MSFACNMTVMQSLSLFGLPIPFPCPKGGSLPLSDWVVVLFVCCSVSFVLSQMDSSSLLLMSLLSSVLQIMAGQSRSSRSFECKYSLLCPGKTSRLLLAKSSETGSAHFKCWMLTCDFMPVFVCSVTNVWEDSLSTTWYPGSHCGSDFTLSLAWLSLYTLLPTLILWSFLLMTTLFHFLVRHVFFWASAYAVHNWVRSRVLSCWFQISLGLVGNRWSKLYTGSCPMKRNSSVSPVAVWGIFWYALSATLTDGHHCPDVLKLRVSHSTVLRNYWNLLRMLLLCGLCGAGIWCSMCHSSSSLVKTCDLHSGLLLERISTGSCI